LSAQGCQVQLKVSADSGAQHLIESLWFTNRVKVNLGTQKHWQA